MTKRKPPEEHKQGGRPKKWTEEVAVALANDLIEWQLALDENIYWEKYLVVIRGLYPEIVSQLTSQYPKFAQLIKRAKKIQEFKLVEKEGKGEIKSMFILKNHHGYADKQEIKQETRLHQTVEDLTTLGKMQEEELRDRLRWLTEKQRN